MGLLKEVLEIYNGAVEKKSDELAKRSIEIITNDIRECAKKGNDHVIASLCKESLAHKESVKRVISHFKGLGFKVDTGEALSPVQISVIIKWVGFGSKNKTFDDLHNLVHNTLMKGALKGMTYTQHPDYATLTWAYHGDQHAFVTSTCSKEFISEAYKEVTNTAYGYMAHNK